MIDVIFIPGLGDYSEYIKRITKRWPSRYDINMVIFKVGWNGSAANYQQKYQDLAKLLRPNHKAAIIGISAGGSFAVNSLRRYPNKISCAISICGPTHIEVGDYSSALLVDSPLLTKSIKECESASTLAGKIMTLRPIHE